MRQRTVRLEDAENLVSGHSASLSNAMRVTQDDTNLRGGQTLLGEAADLLNSLVGSSTSPRGGSALPGQSTSSDSLSIAVNTTHSVSSTQIQTKQRMSAPITDKGDQIRDTPQLKNQTHFHRLKIHTVMQYNRNHARIRGNADTSTYFELLVKTDQWPEAA